MQRQPRVKSVDRTQPMEMNEMYEEVCLPTNRAGGRANPNPYQGVEQNIVSDTPAAVTNTKPKKNKATGYFIVGTLFLSLLALSLIAVVIYSAQTRTVSQDNVASLQAEVQQLKRQLEKLQVIQGTNFTVDQLTSMQNKLEQLTNFETSATSQLISVQSLVQTLSRVQTNTVDELSALHTVNLYQNCIEETRSCDISVSSSASYWRSCGTSGLRINRTGYYTTGMRCEYETSYSYLEATVLRKSGSNVYCYCDVTYPGSSHNALSTSLTATCTLIVSRCRLEQNILN